MKDSFKDIPTSFWCFNAPRVNYIAKHLSLFFLIMVDWDFASNFHQICQTRKHIYGDTFGRFSCLKGNVCRLVIVQFTIRAICVKATYRRPVLRPNALIHRMKQFKAESFLLRWAFDQFATVEQDGPNPVAWRNRENVKEKKD